MNSVQILGIVGLAIVVAGLLRFLVDPDYGDVGDRACVPWEDEDE